MAKVMLSTPMLAPVSDYSQQIALDRCTEISGSASLSGEVRQYAGRRLRLITTGHDTEMVELKLQWVTIATRERLKFWRGELCLYRDGRGRLLFGSLLEVHTDEVKMPGRLCNLSLTFMAVTHSIKV
jgi:hypothetical protein